MSEINSILEQDNLESKIVKQKGLIKGLSPKEYALNRYRKNSKELNLNRRLKYKLDKSEKLGQKFKEVYGRLPSPQELRQWLNSKNKYE